MANKRTEQQAAAYSRSGRARTSDRRFLESDSLDGRRPTGRGAWKCWTPEPVLRSAFSDEKGAYRQTASQEDGAGHMHAGGSRFVIAGATVSGQEKGFQEWKDTSQSDGFLCFAHNMMFDESSFELRPAGRGALESHSIFCSHAQSTGITRNQEVLDENLILVPKSLCPTNSSTMWRGLSAGSGGYDEALSGLQSGFVAFLTTCDAQCANIKLIVEVHRSEASGPAGPHASDIVCPAQDWKRNRAGHQILGQLGWDFLCVEGHGQESFAGRG